MAGSKARGFAAMDKAFFLQRRRLVVTCLQGLFPFRSLGDMVNVWHALSIKIFDDPAKRGGLPAHASRGPADR